MAKDWTGSENSIFKTLGSSHHCDDEREENDFYATSPHATEWLLKLEDLNHWIWQPACGEGHISKILESNGHHVISTDLINRGYGTWEINWLATTNNIQFTGDIVTNPPYKFATEFIIKSLSIIPDGCKVCMFLKVQFMEGKLRRKLFELHPPKRIWVSSSRINCAKNGDFKGLRTTGGSAVAYAWYVWEKGYRGDTILKWFN